MDPQRCRYFFRRLFDDWELILEESHLFVDESPGVFSGKYIWNNGSSGLYSWMQNGGVPYEVMQTIPLIERDEYQPIRWIKEYILK